MNTLYRFLFLTLIIFIVAYTTVAFTSSQTDQRIGGEGVSSVSGWDVSGVHYLLANDSSNLARVEFDLNGPASVVKVSLSTSGAFFACRNTGGYHWMCDINVSMSVSEIKELKVIATGG